MGICTNFLIRKKPVRTAAGSSGFHLRKMLYLKLSTALYSNSYYIICFEFFEGVGNFLERKFLTKTYSQTNFPERKPPKNCHKLSIFTYSACSGSFACSVFCPRKLGSCIPARANTSSSGGTDFIIPEIKFAVDVFPSAFCPPSQTVTLSI